MAQVLAQTEPVFPYPDYQWIEDRFWIWVHYILLKTGRGENLEAFDAFGFLRMVIFGPLLHIHNGGLPRGVRRVETALKPEDLDQLNQTIPQGCNKAALLTALHHSVALYRELRANLYGPEVEWQQDTEEKVMAYLTLF